MNTKLLITSFLLTCMCLRAQTVTQIYKIDDLLKRTNKSDTIYVVNFWAVWCKPCVQELPSFDSLYQSTKNKPIKIILVSLDFKEDLESKVNVFLKKKKIQSECVLLDEINGNDFINKVDKAWTGAIPATLFTYKSKKKFLEKKVTLFELERELKELQK
jgi:thiol-disulfide isomerase/thioredoxin